MSASLSYTNLRSVNRDCDEKALGEHIGANEENALGEEVGNSEEEKALGEEASNNEEDALGEDAALGEGGNKDDALGEDVENREDARRLDKLLENSLVGCFGFKDSPQHEHIFGSSILLPSFTFFTTGLCSSKSFSESFSIAKERRHDSHMVRISESFAWT
ncbi:hypothetical protein HanRHA438_Chr01g0045971 [Helianthus annuus]|nr:hypothetical protein HanRHA438_Chr01g0045971 [Helianthus annuus]